MLKTDSLDCIKHHWTSPRMRCLHCLTEEGGKVQLVSFQMGNHGHILYSIKEKGQSLPYVMECCSLTGDWDKRVCSNR